MWNQILGDRNACPNFTKYPLWYAHYDSQPVFDDWNTSKFAGWTVPTIKQYNGDSVICGSTMDVDYF